MGKNILIKASLASIPIYNMFVLQIPSKVYKGIDALQRIFLWSDSDLPLK